MMFLMGTIAFFAVIGGVATAGVAIYQRDTYGVNIFKTGIFGRENLRLDYANDLFKCKACGKLSRRYQHRMYQARHHTLACPHCEQSTVLVLGGTPPEPPTGPGARYLGTLGYHSPDYEDVAGYIGKPFTEVKEIDSWMDTHADCPKIDYKSLKDVDKTIELIQNLQKEEKEMIRFEQYNNLKIDYKWIENLNKESNKGG